jgi:beta-galactosidase
MISFSKKFILSFFVVLACIFSGQAAMSSGTSRYDVPFNLDWKFTTGSPANAQNATFNDAAWSTVSVPHSASYNAPTHALEQQYYTGDYWYRKKFVCPASARKVFLHFEAIMQTATVFVNGTPVGTHDNSGYTGFFFDISNNVVRGDTTCVAVHANVVQTDLNIPPGGGGTSAPDFELFSGMYRDVWLEFKDSVYVPNRGSHVTTNASTVRAVTSVTNSTAAAKNVTVTLTLRNAAGTSVATGTTTQSVAAGATSGFDITTGAVTGPTLWSPTNPYRYSLQTLVTVGTTVVDSIVEKVGLRTFAWNTGKFSLNGTVTEIKGVCLSQFMGWILNAVPDSRFAKQVALIKAMGINSIRCAHYPRTDAFYKACDSVGMLVYVEVPTWGVNGGFAGNTAFWNNIYSCDSEMVLDGYNHPCIYAWGEFNEQNENLNTQFNNEMAIIHALDPVAGNGRVCAVANYSAAGTKWTGDIHAENYTTGITGLNTEAYGEYMTDVSAHGNWFRNYIRGGTMDVDPAGEATQEVNCMVNDYWGANNNMGGGHFWCFVDYSSGRNTVGREGIVDRLWLPKQAYFAFRNRLTGAATDYWTTGTPTQLALTTDITSLRADGSDIALITATLRNASGACVQTACNITFTASPAGCVTALYTGHSTAPTSGNPVTCAVEGGRAGILVRTSRTAGTITVTATSSCGLTAASVNITSNAVTEPIPTFAWGTVPVLKDNLSQFNTMRELKTVYTGKGILLSFPTGMEKSVKIINGQGKVVASYALKNGKQVLVDKNVTGNGIFYAVWNENGRKQMALNIVR